MRFSCSAEFEVVDLGRTDYAAVDASMMERLEAIVAGYAPDQLLLAEFDPVLTVGRAGGAGGYEEMGIPVHEIARGGKATFHGPGQLVAYPLIRLGEGSRDLHSYLHALEEALIRCVGDFGLIGQRDPRNTGCWIGGHKVASIGVAVRKWVTYHGVALNVDTDLAWFRKFDPCGLEPDLMTTMAKELDGEAPGMGDVCASLAAHMQGVLRADS
ncbi:MAG: lipoyl(octanoyl) transferase LipB [Planctomycetota bacterium]|jgi:lipoate-protein ligase B